MRILVVCSGNAPGFEFSRHQAFIHDQIEAVKREDPTVQFDLFFITGKGFWGYLLCRNQLLRQLRRQPYQCIHAHVAASGLLANLQRDVPVVTTFHGSDINQPVGRVLSALVHGLSRRTIYVSRSLAKKRLFGTASTMAVIPCGVDMNLFKPQSKVDCRKALGLSPDRQYVLFSSGFEVPVKNASLAKQAVARLQNPRVDLLELKNYSREQVAQLFSAVDVALLTSFSEGSPQFVKEALACNCPVVSTDVGDVREVMEQIPGCYLTSFDPADVAEKIRLALANSRPVASRKHVYRFDNQMIARQLSDIYQITV